jgi:hypothetical protein
MTQWSDHIRGARLSDAAALAGLSTQLGYPSTEAQVRERLCLQRLWIRAKLARVGPHEFYEAIGCRTVKDQRVYEYPL